MSSSGIVYSGWTDNYIIPGEFKEISSIHGSIVDIDGNGKPDLLIYFTQKQYLRWNYSYFCVGKDLNSEGIAEGGWTDHEMTPFRSDRNFAMNVEKDFESDRYEIILADIRQRDMKIGPVGQWEWKNELHLSFSHNDIFNGVMETAKKYSAIETVMGKCGICYDGNVKEIDKCQRKLDMCKVEIDKLDIVQDLPGESIASTTRTEMNYRNVRTYSTYAQESRNTTINYFIEAASRYNMDVHSNSIYCTGFRYFVNTEDVCNTIEAKSVYSKGLEIVFTKYLSETITEERDINSTSLFEDPLGTSGAGYPILVQAEIRGREKPTGKKIKNALRKVRAMQQLPEFNDLKSLRGKALFKTTKEWNKWKKVWTITFHFRASVANKFW